MFYKHLKTSNIINNTYPQVLWLSFLRVFPVGILLGKNLIGITPTLLWWTGAIDGNRTRTVCLEGRSSAIKLQLHFAISDHQLDDFGGIRHIYDRQLL